MRRQHHRPGRGAGAHPRSGRSGAGAARQAIDRTGTGLLLTARTEGFIVGRPDLDETIRRLVAFADAGAECLYAPGVQRRDEIAAVVEAVAPRPVNVLVGADFGLSDRWRGAPLPATIVG